MQVFSETLHYELGVNSDDGFLLTVGHSRFGPVIASFNGGRGAADTLGWIVVEEDGVYPIRLSWWQGNGGGNVEFFSVNPATGEKTLINDPFVSGSIKAYSKCQSAGRLASFGVTLRDNGVPRQPSLVAGFVNDLTSVDQSSIKLFLDGAAVNATTTSSGSTVTTRFNVPTQFAFGSTHTGAVVYAIGGTTMTNTITFSVRVEGAADLPGGLAIDIEMFDYDGGQAVPSVNTMPYTGSEYSGLGAVNDVDYHQGGTETSNDNYRFGEDPNVPMDSQLGADLDTIRPGGWTVTENYKIGWAGGDWYNFTRTFTNGNYKIYAAQSHGDAAGTPDRLVARYGIVTSGQGTSSQTTVDIGSYSEPATGGWGNNALVKAKGANGQDAIVHLSGVQTIRVWVESGDYDWFAFVPTSDSTPQPSIASVTPEIGTGSFGSVPLNITLTDFLLETSINVPSIRLTVNGADVTAQATVTDTEGGATVNYAPVDGFPNGVQNYTVSFTNSAGARIEANGWFTSLRQNNFVIEAEDFNYDGGKTKAEASTMPLMSDLYTGLSAVAEVDYHVINDEMDPNAQAYRMNESPNVPITVANGDLNRGSFTLTANYRIGWIDNGEWWNYTRTFPNGNYNVYAGLSHGGGGPTSGSLQRVTGNITMPNQTVEQLGTFNVAGNSGGWGVNRLVPLKNSNGDLATVALSGTETIRYTASSGDWDYLVLAPAGGGGGNGPRLTVSRSGNNITITWTGGTLQSSTTVNGGYAPVNGATGGTYTTTATGQRLFFRAVQ